MRTVSSSVLLSVSLLAALALAPARGHAQPGVGVATAVAGPGADAYTQQVQTGIQALITGDTAGAMTAFRAAAQLDGGRPMAPYYLAAANRMTGNLDEALTGFRAAAQLAQAANEPRWRARALQGVASTLERMDGQLPAARDAWQEYVRFADSNTAVAHPQLGRARVQAITVMTEQENAYVTVRERIAEREREQAAETPPTSRRAR